MVTLCATFGQDAFIQILFARRQIFIQLLAHVLLNLSVVLIRTLIAQEVALRNDLAQLIEVIDDTLRPQRRTSLEAGGLRVGSDEIEVRSTRVLIAPKASPKGLLRAAMFHPAAGTITQVVRRPTIIIVASLISFVFDQWEIFVLWGELRWRSVVQ